ncbi:MAG: hypothetical protein VKJ24_17145 [Synechococcales bacterium]|nr:hypothetical protein [Synechococcales bacterium]
MVQSQRQAASGKGVPSRENPILGEPWEKGAIAAFVILGCGLRFLWAGDMKWAGDEQWMYDNATAVVQGQQVFPWVGMRNGVGFANPGLSVWVFILLRGLASDPISLVQWIQGVNVLAIALLAVFIVRCIPKQQQHLWGWGMAIAAVNPLAIFFSRALWAQDLLPLFSILMLVGHWFRQTRWGAFVWSLLGMLSGQVHMSGFFWFASLTIATGWNEIRRMTRKNVPVGMQYRPVGMQYRRDVPAERLYGTDWLAWLAGIAIGLIPLLPWLLDLTVAVKAKRPSWAELLTPNFHLHWLTTGWGLNLEYIFGGVFWRSLWQEPRIAGIATGGVGLCLLMLVGLALVSLGRWIRQWRDRHVNSTLQSYFWAGGLIMPILLLVARVRVPAHYLIILFPWLYLWVASLWHDRPKILTLITVLQLSLSLTYLLYVHLQGGVPGGNFGWSYQYQMRSL